MSLSATRSIAPVIAITEIGEYEVGKEGIDITLTYTKSTAADAENEPTEIIVTKYGKDEEASAAVSAGTVAITETGEYTYTAESDGWYIFTATDGANNATTVTTSKYVEVGSDSLFQAPTFAVIDPNTLEGEEVQPTGALKTVRELATAAYYGEDGVDSNGTFTYLEVIEPTAEDYTMTYTLKKATEGAYSNVEWSVGTAITTAGDYELTVRAALTDNLNDYKEESYRFSIVDNRADFKTVDGNKQYRITDYVIMGKVIGGTFADAAQYFKGGYFSGNVSGSLAENYFGNDRDALLLEMKTSNTWKNYDLAIYNGLAVIE